MTKEKLKEYLLKYLKTEGGLVLSNQIAQWFITQKKQCEFPVSLEEILNELKAEKKIFANENGAKAI